MALTSTVTIAHAPLAIPGGNGYTVDATWYFPNQAQPPVGLIYLQHGFTRNSGNATALAQDLAERTNSIVVAPNISSNSADPYYIWNSPIARAVATMFEGDRAELTASASLAAGQPIVLPQQFVMGGGSAGGNLVAEAAEFLADDGATENLKALILFDTTNAPYVNTGLAKLSGTNSVPVMLLAAPPCSCNDYGRHTQRVLDNAPDQFIGVLLDNGSHLDGEGTTTDASVVQLCGGPILPQNATAAQVITAAWIYDAFTGSHTGIYGPQGTVVSIGGATARVNGVGDLPI
jgi:dienelactone hydrolase